jgi:hypothetical protein
MPRGTKVKLLASDMRTTSQGLLDSLSVGHIPSEISVQEGVVCLGC